MKNNEFKIKHEDKHTPKDLVLYYWLSIKTAFTNLRTHTFFFIIIGMALLGFMLLFDETMQINVANIFVLTFTLGMVFISPITIPGEEGMPNIVDKGQFITIFQFDLFSGYGYVFYPYVLIIILVVVIPLFWRLWVHSFEFWPRITGHWDNIFADYAKDNKELNPTDFTTQIIERMNKDPWWIRVSAIKKEIKDDEVSTTYQITGQSKLWNDGSIANAVKKLFNYEKFHTIKWYNDKLKAINEKEKIDKDTD